MEHRVLSGDRPPRDEGKRLAFQGQTSLSARVDDDSKHHDPIAPNILDRDFTATKPNGKWVADITYVATDEGWLHLAVVEDLFSRMIVGWAVNDDLMTS